MFGRSIVFLLVFLFAVSLCGQASAATYDFGILGAAGSGGAGFKTQGDKFKVSNAFEQGDDVYGAVTALWAGDATGLTSGATSTLTIKAEGGVTNKHFTLNDMNFDVTPGAGNLDLDVFTITLKDSGGSTIATHSLSSNVSIPMFSYGSKWMSTFPFSVPFPVAGYNYVSEISITWHFAAGHAPAELNFNSITVTNVSAIPLPSATTAAASGIAATGATLNGTVNANGNSTAVTFEYGTTTGYGSSATATQSPVTGSSNTAVSAPISGLACGGTTYHFRVKGVNGGGTTNGGDLTFTTGACGPTVTGISPTSGSTTGGTSVTITGTNFTGATAVKFGLTNATGYTVNSATQITATSPAGAGGTVDVTVTTAGGTSATGASDQYTYIAAPTVTGISPNSGPAAGGTSVTITGTGLTGATAVTIGGAAATGITVVNDTTLTATTPAGTAGARDVVVTTPGGTGTGAGLYTYLVAPIVTTSTGSTANTPPSAAAIDPALTVTDANSPTLASATVSISNNFQAGQDILDFTNNPATMGNIGASYAAVTGILTMTSSGATATVTQWQTALRAVTYANSAATPNASIRTISFVANDGTSNSLVATKNLSLTLITAPNAFSFNAQTGAALSSVATSNTITVAGINSAASISIAGGTYSINSGGYTSTPGTVSNGDEVTVRQTSSASYNTLTTATLTIGWIEGSFHVITLNLAVSSIVVDPAAPATLYAGLDGAGVYKSTDGSASWIAASTQPTNTRVKALVIKPGDSAALFAATYGGGVFKSSDSGVNWSACATQPANLNLLSLTMDASGKLYAGSEAGVFVSSDGCANWAAMNTGLPL